MNNNSFQRKQLEDVQSIRKKGIEQTQIMIAESENELLLLFKACLSSVGLSVKTANSGQKALDCFLDSKQKGIPLDGIVLDTHLSNPSGLDVAKKIRIEKPDQKLVLVTTTPKEYLPVECLRTAGIKDKDILTMPFRMSKLVSILKDQFLIF